MDFFQDIKIDPRVKDIPLIGSAYQMPLIIFAYIYFVLVCGPRFMKNRQPYSLKTFIQLYNVMQFVVNVWLVYIFLEGGLLSRKLFCPIEMDYSSNPTTMKIISCAWGYFLLKILDYIETIIFVLRKKTNQISGLHVYHHVSTSMIAWFGIKYYCVAPLIFICTINNFVHAIMYIYYFLAVCGPDIQKTIAPMKRYVTIIQMVQFCLIILYVSQNFITYCKVVPHWIVILFIQNILLNFFLFYNFYKKTYINSKKIQ